MRSDEALARLAGRVGRHLSASGSTLATAESCTGGWIAKVCTDIPGSSAYFLEGFVTYSNAAKRQTLGVPASVLERDGAVSRRTAHAMARGALDRSGATMAVAVTGIAGPGGAVPGKPVGTVWFCWASQRGKAVKTTAVRKLFRGDRDAVRRKTVVFALREILRS